MKFNGTATLNAPAERVWAALNDPDVLVRTIPGCEQLETVGPDAYRMTVTAGVASIKGTYLGDVRLTDPQPPAAFTLQASGAGAPGTVSANVRVTLSDTGNGTTLLSYDADAVVGGPVGGVGQRVLAGVAKKTAGEFFQAVDAVLTQSVDAEPSVDGRQSVDGQRSLDGQQSVDAEPTVFRKPPKPAGPAARDLRGQLTGALVGAGIALVGVWLGWRIARRP